MPLSNLKKTLLKPFEFMVVVGYIIFEEIIWNTVAKPIFESLKSLAILEGLKQTFLNMNRYLLVSVFLVILIIAEYMGVLSLITIAQNQVLLGAFIYALKIPLATFTFWLFELTKPQLMTFGWLKVSYETLMKAIDFVVHSTIYLGIKTKVHAVKQQLKNSAAFKVLLASYKRIKAIFITSKQKH